MKKIKQLLLLSVFVAFLVSCGKDDTIVAPPTPPTPPTPQQQSDPKEISKFIWEGLDMWYLWENKIEALALEENSEEWKKYLNNYGDKYEDLFESLLYRQRNAQGKATVDKWSWIVDDYQKQDDSFKGISESFGYEFKLSKYGENGSVLGYVTYIMKDSPADNSELKRGDIFISVNGTELTVDNYRDLLFTNKTYTLGFADIKNKTVTPNNKEVTLTAVKLTENPIHTTKVITLDNGTKVGYLLYNSFTGTDEFNLALNESFKQMKTEGATELVLDLRYNGGGSVYSAILLGSMIYGSYTDKVFSQSMYNDLIQNYYVKKYGANELKDNFTDKIKGGANRRTNLGTINSLGLNRLYVIASPDTASASELIINGLRPYIEVIIIGQNTHGKYVGSITLKDYIDDKGTVNPNHKYAMQPIVLKIANANGESDYINGFAPKYERNEWNYLGNIKPLGDVNEPMLKAALADISGNPETKKDPQAIAPSSNVLASNKQQLGYSTLLLMEELFDSKEAKPLNKQMYDERVNINIKELKEFKR